MSSEPAATGKSAQPSVLDWALFYLRLGYCVIPVRPERKKPHIYWKEFQQRLPTEDEVRGWWRRWPNARIGIVTGTISGGLVVLDVDPRHKGDESIKGLPLPVTPMVRSGGDDDGVHAWFITTTPLRKSQGFFPGVDLQAEGAFVVAPPSLHQKTGKPYTWFNGLGLDDVERAPVPDWIAKRAKAVASLPKMPRIASVISADAFNTLSDDPICIKTLEQGRTIKVGQRNLATLNHLGYLRSRGFSIEDAIRLVQAMIHRLLPGVSSSPLIEQLDNVVSVATAVYGSPGGQYLFHCAYVVGMGMPCAGAACPLFEIAGRSSKLRKWMKVSDEPAPSQTTGVPLEEVRRQLREQIQQIADNPDGKFHTFKIESGVGKTVAASEVLLSKGVIYFAATHAQLKTPEAIAVRLGVNYCLFPKLDEENCKHADIVRRQMQYGLNYTKVICPSCDWRKDCPYLQAQKPGDTATSILLVQKYHEFPTFYDHHENHRREFIVFDEDPLAVLRPQRTLTSEGLTSFRRLLRQALDFDPEAKASGEQLILRPDSFSHPQPPAVRTNLQVLIEMADGLRAAIEAESFPMISPDLRARYITTATSDTLKWVYECLKSAFRSQKKVITLTNYFQELDELLTDRARGLTMTAQGLCFSVNYPPPPGHTAIVLDATAKAEDFRDVVGDREIVEHRLPPVAHDSRIYQLLNANWSRRSVAIDTEPQELKKTKTMSRPNKTMGKLLAAIVRRHPGKSIGIITHKASEKFIRQQLPDGIEPRFGHYGDQRGSNDFVDVGVLVVAGSPLIPTDAIRAKAVSLCGHDVPVEDMGLVWREVRGLNGTFIVEVRGFRSPEMQAAYTHCVSNELIQALGRARYVQGGKIVYLLTNEPIAGVANIEFVTKKDLVGGNPVRVDSLYPQVAAFVQQRFAGGQAVAISDVQVAFPATARPTLSTHLTRAAKALGGIRQRRQWVPAPSGIA